MKCKDCKWRFADKPMYCERHAPIAIANPNYSNGGDSRITLTIQPIVYGDCRCGDFEPKKIKQGTNHDHDYYHSDCSLCQTEKRAKCATS